jgi:hypothetical protein
MTMQMKSENGTGVIVSEATALNGSSNGTNNTNPSTTPPTASKKRSGDPFKSEQNFLSFFSKLY